MVRGQKWAAAQLCLKSALAFKGFVLFISR